MTVAGANKILNVNFIDFGIVILSNKFKRMFKQFYCSKEFLIIIFIVGNTLVVVSPSRSVHNLKDIGKLQKSLLILFNGFIEIPGLNNLIDSVNLHLRCISLHGKANKNIYRNPENLSQIHYVINVRLRAASLPL